MRYPQYPVYIKTENRFWKSIPKGWNLRKMKFMATIQNGRDHKEVESEEGFNVLGSGGVFGKATSYLHDGESVLLGRKGTIDTPLYVNEQFWTVDTMYYTVVQKNTLPKFLYYLAKAIPFQYLATQTTLPSMTQFDLGNFFLCFPEYKEQQKIAAFLDYKTQQIDQLIAKKKALIEKLEEKRIAVITQAVTKGLDKNVTLKPSGVDWLGDVPEHWGVERLRFSIVSNPVKSEVAKLEDDTMVSFVPMESVAEYGGMDVSQEKMLEEVYNGYTYFRNDDVVVAKITPCFENGKGSLVPELKSGVGFGTTEFHVVRALENIEPEYLFFVTITDPFRAIGVSEMLGAGGQKRIPEDFIKDFRFGVPPTNEQKKILVYLQKSLGKMNEMKVANKLAIDKLEEYRSAIITSAVTGKIDVREVEIPKEVA